MSSQPVIDFHTHVAGICADKSGCMISPEMQNSWKFTAYLKAFGVTKQQLLETGDAIVVDVIDQRVRQSVYVDKAILLAFDMPHTSDGTPQPEEAEMVVPNDWLAEQVKGRESLLWGASIHPARKDAADALEKAVADEAVIMKWLPNVQKIDPSDEVYIPFYDLLKKHKLPLLVHSGDEDSFTRTDNKLGDPRRLRLPLSRGVTVIAAHAASAGESDGKELILHLVEMLKEFPNLYTDFSALTQINRRRHIPRVLEDDAFKERLIYGSDYPLIQTPLVSPLFYLTRLPFKTVWKILRTKNGFDRDVLLKKSLGFTEADLTRAAVVLDKQ